MARLVASNEVLSVVPYEPPAEEVVVTEPAVMASSPSRAGDTLTFELSAIGVTSVEPSYGLQSVTVTVTGFGVTVMV